MIGQIVAQYRIEEKLGSGGMAVVYRAVHQRLGRQVALKFLPRRQEENRAQTRLLQEAQTASALDHPNICTIYDIEDSHDGPHFIAMAYYDGETLEQRIRRQPMSLQETMDFGAQIASGLAAAHDHGIVHCDIKPANLMLTSEGLVKILDFGIAKLSGEEKRDRWIVGSVPYMSPEQIRGKALDHRTDIWSLGVVLYQMATGRRPFPGADHNAVRQAILRQDPEPIADYPQVGELRLEQILRWALAKNRDDRYRNARELHEELSAPLGAAPKGPSLVEPAAFDSRVGVTADSETTERHLFFSTPEERKIGAPSIAVLPFADLSADGDHDYLCCGIAEELISQLLHIQGLKVAGRTSAFQISLADLDLKQIGERLEVRTVLEGSIRVADGQLRVTARLVATADNQVLWSETYDSQLTGLFDIQDTIARQIAEALEVTLVGPLKVTRPGTDTGNFAAYNLYLKGRYSWNLRTDQELRQAVKYFTASIREEPEYSRAHAGLADAYAMQGIYGMVAPAEVMPRAMAAAQEALKLDDSLAEAYTSRGCVRSTYEWDFARASHDFERAIELDSSYATAYQWLAMNCLVPKRRFEQALEQLEQAEALDPASKPILTSQGLCHLFAGRPRDAAQRLQQVLDMEGGKPPLALVFLSQALTQMGDLEGATQAGLEAVELTQRRPNTTVALALCHASRGDSDQAWWLLDKLLDESRGLYVPPTSIAQLYCALGELELALHAIERAVRVRTCDLIWLAVDPAYSPLHDLLAFRKILESIGLAPRTAS